VDQGKRESGTTEQLRNPAQMRALFAEKAWAFTTWSGGIPIDDFVGRQAVPR
jgi:hypothetical protein